MEKHLLHHDLKFKRVKRFLCLCINMLTKQYVNFYTFEIKKKKGMPGSV